MIKINNENNGNSPNTKNATERNLFVSDKLNNYTRALP